MTDDNWIDEEQIEETDGQIDEYDITATPNDFNLLTLKSFIEGGAIKIPGFQRNYVWDRARASKLIESLIIGIPVPQVFLYEEGRNKFLVVDGQQRLMSIFYFYKQRFPRKEKRAEIREIFDRHKGIIPEDFLHDDTYFEKFNLLLKNGINNANKFSGKNYSTLGDYKTQFDFRALRNIVVRQNNPQNDNSAIYEVFNRLNTGGVNLRPQEIRTSMYHSPFYDMLYSINMRPEWRKLISRPQLDLHSKDIEILLRCFAFLENGTDYKPSLVNFLNNYSKEAKKNKTEKNDFLNEIFTAFITACADLDDKTFINPRNERFNAYLLEAVFHASLKTSITASKVSQLHISQAEVDSIANDEEFIAASLEGTTRSDNVEKRLRIAREKMTEAV